MNRFQNWIFLKIEQNLIWTIFENWTNFEAKQKFEFEEKIKSKQNSKSKSKSKQKIKSEFFLNLNKNQLEKPTKTGPKETRKT
jgi:hypothetical protein